MTAPTTGPRTILVPVEAFAKDGARWTAVVRVILGEPGDRTTPPSPHEADALEPGTARRCGALAGDLAVPHDVRARLYGAALLYLPAPGTSASAWERWHEEHGLGVD